MSLLGIDVGTTGCKAALFSPDAGQLASAYEEYDVQRPQPGYAELDALQVWEKVKAVIRRVGQHAGADPIQALAVSSLGEAVVPVTCDRRVLGPALLNFNRRGEEFLPGLAGRLDNPGLYRINGNTLGNHYSLTKLMWLKAHAPELYARTDQFLHWSGFVSFMLGAEPVVDYALANRTLLFDLERQDWSDELLDWAGLDGEKLPPPKPAGGIIGALAPQVAAELGLPAGIAIVSGSHDQCCNAIGCGVVQAGMAVYGMGTYHCITPAFSQRKDPAEMLALGLNTEHHAVPGLYVSFIYNTGGALVKWYRDTFASAEKEQALKDGRYLYADLIAEIPVDKSTGCAWPSEVLVLPHFAPTGPPEFVSDSSGVMIGLKLETRRGEILQGILEGTTYYLKEIVEPLPQTGIQIDAYRAVGGGSKSDAWIRLCADILGRPFVRPQITEAGALGAAILAGVGQGAFASVAEGVEALVRIERTFEPDAARQRRYQERFEQYRQIWPLMKGFLRQVSSDMGR